MFGRHDHLALHQAPGGEFGIAQRLSHRRRVTGFQRVEDRVLLVAFQILDQVDDVVGVQLAHGIGQDRGRQRGKDLFAQRLVEFGQDLAVEFAVVEPDQAHPLEPADLFEKVGDVGGVQRLHQLDKLVPVLDIHRVENRRDGRAVERIGVVGLGGFCLQLFGHALPSTCRRPTL